MRRTLSCLLVGAVSSVGLVAVNPAGAEPKADRGKAIARVTVAKPAAKKLRRADIKLKAVKPAKRKMRKRRPVVKFPIAKRNKRIVKLRGGMRFKSSGARAKITRLKGNFRTGRVTALVNGAKRKAVFNVRRSKAPKLGKYRLVLTRYSAGSMNATFDTKAFSKGDTFAFAKLRR